MSVNGRLVLQFELLKLIEQGGGKWSWHDLAVHLSNQNVPRRPDMLVVLKGMARTGLVYRTVEPGSPADRWTLTGRGDRLLTGLRKETGPGELTIVVSRTGLLAAPKVKNLPGSAVDRNWHARSPSLKVSGGRVIANGRKGLRRAAWQNKVSARELTAADLRL